MKLIRAALVLLLVLISAPVMAEDLPDEQKKDRLEFAAIPALNFSSDSGFGFGAIGAMYGKTPELKPYRFATDLQIFLTTKGQHSHFLRLDWLNAFNLPLRFRARAGFLATVNQNFCREGTLANCIPDPTKDNNYYLIRYFEGYGNIEGRWRLRPQPHQIELVGSYRGSFYQPGTWGDLTPYANSLFALSFPGGQRGFASIVELGLMFDNRDQEASPTSGYWIEASIRESLPLLGSQWQYFGANLSARAYIPFDEAKRVVLASQMIIDAMIGDAPLAEIVRVGNSLRFTAFGGAEIGRGIREQYFPGRLKLIKQLELRYRFVDFNVSTQRFDLSCLFFGDLATIAWRLDSLEVEPKKPLVGFGGGLRINWNTDFVIRLDLGLSPIENYAPKVYIKVGNVF